MDQVVKYNEYIVVSSNGEYTKSEYVYADSYLQYKGKTFFYQGLKVVKKVTGVVSIRKSE